MRPALALCALALAACSRPAAAPAPAAAAPPAAATVPADVLAALDAPWPSAGPDGRVPGELARSELPLARPGKWTLTITHDGRSETREICENGEFPDFAPDPSCPNVILRRAPSGFTVDWRCATATATARMFLRAQGDFATAYTADTVLRTVATGGKVTVTPAHQEARRIGECG